MKILKLFLYMALFLSLSMIGFTISGYMWFSNQILPPGGGKHISVSVKPGSNTKQIATILKQKGIIKSALLLRLYIRFLAVDYRLRPGNYSFTTNDTINTIADKLLRGTAETTTVTIQEGSTINEIGRLLQLSNICSKASFIEAVTDPKLLGSVFNNWDLIPAAEGLAFPETYRFASNTPATIVAKRMLKLARHNIDKILPKELPLGLTPYEVCILASIVEREARLDSERAIIASVFYNRLKRKIKLESCATVQYILPQHKGRLLFKDLKVDSPYNTYKHLGLPPTPISNFGRASLIATAFPEKTKYLYFVSDGNVGHRFSKTLRQHNVNKKKFFKTRRTNK